MGTYLHVDRLIVGAGIFGLFAALVSRRRGHSVAVIDADRGPLLRASLVNQARIHMGYHYPRSAFTAVQASRRSEQFSKDFPEAVVTGHRQVYAIAAAGSLTDAKAFERFCRSTGISLESIDPGRYFDHRAIEAAYETEEYCFDVTELRTALLERLEDLGSVVWRWNTSIQDVEGRDDRFLVGLRDGTMIAAGGIINAAYAGTNHILGKLGLEPVPLKYELCELALTRIEGPLGEVGITVMDGPFFSLTPYGRSGFHALSAVDLTPRLTSVHRLPTFPCQASNPRCSPGTLDNCSPCGVRPPDMFPVMRQLVRRFLRPDLSIEHHESMYAVKAVLRSAEVDDSRPTMVVRHVEEPLLATVFSGKVTTLYDLEDLL